MRRKDSKKKTELNILKRISFQQNNSFNFYTNMKTSNILSKRESIHKKEKGYCTTMELRDFKGEDTVEVLVGMSTGKIILFDSNTGHEYFNFYIDHPVSKFFYGDFILSQRELDEIELEKLNKGEEEEDKDDQIICFAENGDVYGYIYGEKNYVPIEREFESKDKKVTEEELNTYEQLLKEKNKLLDELEDLAVRESNRNKINAPKEKKEEKKSEDKETKEKGE